MRKDAAATGAATCLTLGSQAESRACFFPDLRVSLSQLKAKFCGLGWWFAILPDMFFVKPVTHMISRIPDSSKRPRNIGSAREQRLKHRQVTVLIYHTLPCTAHGKIQPNLLDGANTYSTRPRSDVHMRQHRFFDVDVYTS